jgi:hypothetical protein
VPHTVINQCLSATLTIAQGTFSNLVYVVGSGRTKQTWSDLMVSIDVSLFSCGKYDWEVDEDGTSVDTFSFTSNPYTFTVHQEAMHDLGEHNFTATVFLVDYSNI